MHQFLGYFEGLYSKKIRELNPGLQYIDDLLKTKIKDWSEDILQTSTLMNDHLNPNI